MTDLKLTLTLVGFIIATFLLACFLGSTPLGLEQFFQGLFGFGDQADRLVIWEIRAPRSIAAMLVGGALGLSGAALQGLLRNPLAEPGVLGVSASASLGATLVIFYGLAEFSQLLIPIAAVSTAIIATIFLTMVATRFSSITTLILIGIGLSSVAGAVMALLLNLAPNPFSLADLVNWTLGSVANRSFDDIALAAPLLMLGTIIIMRKHRELAALSLGDEGAFAIGVHLTQTRMQIVLGTGIITGTAVSLAGAIGFVGIVAPHIVRPFVQFNPSRLLLPSALTGGLMLMLADIGVRILPTSTELKLGVVAALVGAPLFILIAAKGRLTND